MAQPLDGLLLASRLLQTQLRRLAASPALQQPLPLGQFTAQGLTAGLRLLQLGGQSAGQLVQVLLQIGQRGGIGEGLVGNGLLSGRWLLSGRRLVLAPGLGDGPGLLGQRLQLATSFGEGRVGLAGAVVEPAAHPLVEHRVEEGLEQGLALLGSSPQHLGETPLRQQDHLAELGGIQPQQPLHLAAHLGDVAGNRLLCPGLGLSLSLSLSLRLRLRLRIEPPEGGAGGLGGGALAPAARHLTGRLALHPPTATAGGELEHHPRHLAWGGMVGAQALDAALARHLAVERKAEGIEQVGLARARAAVD